MCVGTYELDDVSQVRVGSVEYWRYNTEIGEYERSRISSMPAGWVLKICIMYLNFIFQFSPLISIWYSQVKEYPTPTLQELRYLSPFKTIERFFKNEHSCEHYIINIYLLFFVFLFIQFTNFYIIYFRGVSFSACSIRQRIGAFVSTNWWLLGIGFCI